MTDFTPLSVVAVARSVASGARSAVDVAREALDRIAAYDAVQPQAWITRVPQAAVLGRAAEVDARLKAGEDLPLAGATFAVKDNIDVAGLPTTAACPAFAYTPDRSATVVERLEAAGAILVGKTNLDQFATGLNGTRSPHGAPHCVFNRDYVSGGSSSGSAVAAGAGLVAFALGTDTAGSGRVPAAFNNLVGFKPSKGRWSTRGLVPACRSLDCISVFTASAADAALIDKVLAQFDPEDAYSRPALWGRDLVRVDKPTVGVPRPHQLNFLGDAQSAALFAKAVERIHALDVHIVEVDIAPLLTAAQLLYAGPWVAERTAALEGLLKSNPGAIHPVVRAIVQAGVGMSAVEAFKGQYALQAHARLAEAMWDWIDVLLLPTAPTIYRIAEMLAEPVALNANLGLYTNFVNLLDMSAVAVPAGFRENGTGFGVTLIGPASRDPWLLDFAGRYEAVAPAPAAPPLDLGARTATIKLAVVGAHLHGMPLHWQLTSRDARLVGAARTAAVYRLYAIANSTPPKPALIHVGEGGAAIAVEVYELDVEAFGSFTAEVPAPLAIGTVTLEDGSQVKGFVAEPRATLDAEDITALGGWRAFIARA
jgi:allophanate hydrolase